MLDLVSLVTDIADLSSNFIATRKESWVAFYTFFPQNIIKNKVWMLKLTYLYKYTQIIKVFFSNIGLFKKLYFHYNVVYRTSQKW